MRNLLFLLMLLCGSVSAQIEVTHFNAGWNNANDVTWFMDLTDCKTKGFIDVAKDVDAQKEHKIAVVPTIIIFKDGVAEENFKAGLDLECPIDLPGLQEAIKEVREASAF